MSDLRPTFCRRRRPGFRSLFEGGRRVDSGPIRHSDRPLRANTRPVGAIRVILRAHQNFRYLGGHTARAYPGLRHIRASVTGLDKSIPFCVIHSPGTCFCTESAQGPVLMGFVRIGRANLRIA